jgi:hypothetical protein
VGECGLDLSGLRQKPVADSCECGNEPLSSIKGWGISYITGDY